MDERQLYTLSDAGSSPVSRTIRPADRRTVTSATRWQERVRLPPGRLLQSPSLVALQDSRGIQHERGASSETVA